jgi:SAM-dependent methyltransferase
LTRLGQFSNGIQVGLRHGFDSGVSLDYVYQNKPSGRNYLGLLIDRMYLNSVGWKGIRQRKLNLKATLLTVTELLHNQGRAPVIFDVASGPGRYLFEIQNQLDFAVYLYLNDADDHAIKHAKNIADHYQTNNVFYSKINVFSSFKAGDFNKTPNIVIISGLFELYENNQHVHSVISNLYDLLEEGGYLIYTGQPWHPQLELIGRILNNRNGQRWIMRRRVQSEMDQLVESAGFTKLSTESDGFGIFTVSCAQKTNTTCGKGG